ncbi:MAG: ATP-grasp domain-containing protein [Bacteroidota bacterium]
MKNLSSEPPKVYVIHENEEWAAPLLEALKSLGIPAEEWSIAEAVLNIQDVPPSGIFYSKASASAHTRGHASAIEFALPLVQWLESHGRRVINGGATIWTEASKARQYQLLRQAGILIPKTFVANSPSTVLHAALQLAPSRVIVKPNRGGKGSGVQLFENGRALETVLADDNLESIDGLFIVQEYIESPSRQIVRMEFIGGKFQYAVSVDASDGFELCPADACEIPAPSGNEAAPIQNKFEILPKLKNPDIPMLERLMKEQRIDIAGFEYVEDLKGRRFLYDINTNTNYNTDAETRAQVKPGLVRVSEFLGQELVHHYPSALVADWD